VFSELPGRPVLASSVGLGKWLLSSLSRYLTYRLKPVWRNSFTIGRYTMHSFLSFILIIQRNFLCIRKKTMIVFLEEQWNLFNRDELVLLKKKTCIHFLSFYQHCHI
jgi:hypothetical protein